MLLVLLYLCDKTSSLLEEAAGQLESCQSQLCLGEGILHPSSSNIGGTIIQNTVCLPGLQLFLQQLDNKEKYHDYGYPTFKPSKNCVPILPPTARPLSSVLTQLTLYTKDFRVPN